jgi:eukaryotic-like serine/threonine-protein kinase
MPLSVGTRLGPYEILAPLGAGGMGEVYRARDSKLGRDVAIKVLPQAFAADPDRLARFGREARVLASLNHPNIAHIHGFEQSGGTSALVMELVEGETLAERLARGPIPLDEALPIARQIAEALEAAHEQGIIHRDLKPANVKVRPDGTVKVLDFGLAKVLDPPATSGDAMNSPTLSARATRQGVILGTAAYMSPEQAAGKGVDRRTDLWSFGVVLMEMLTGRRVFDGETVSHVMAAVLKSEPDWGALPADTPASVRRLLQRCLEKDRRRRLDSAADARLEIDDASELAAVTGRVSRRTAASWSAVALGFLAGGLLTSAAFGLRRPAGADGGRAPTYAEIEVPSGYVLGEDDTLVTLPLHTPMVFTPDGHALIIQAARDRKPQLFVRSLSNRDALPLAGTEGARAPFVSPDGKWVGFFSKSELRKVPIEGGEPTTVCQWASGLGPNGVSWAGDVILFADEGSSRIMRVSASGGTPVAVTTKPPTPRLHVTPFFLPDGKRFLFADVSRIDLADSHLMIQSLEGGAPREVVSDATDGRILPSGHLVFMRMGSLMSVGFDMSRGQATGDPVVAMRDVMQGGLRVRAGANHTGAGMFAVSSRGDVAAIRGGVVGGEGNRVIWMTPDGRSSPAEPTSGAPEGGRLVPRLSPDGSRFVVAVITALRREIWLADLSRNAWSVCTECGASSLTRFGASWSADGRRLLFEAGNDSVVERRIDGSAPERILIREPNRVLMPGEWLADGRIVYLSAPPSSASDIRLLESGADVGRSIAAGRSPAVSPDRKWLAFVSGQAAQSNVFLQSFPESTTREQVSAGGGADPAWSVDGKTLYYLHAKPEGGFVMMAVSVKTSPELVVGAPRELFASPNVPCAGIRCYDLAPDGRFLLVDHQARPIAAATRMDLILNWASAAPSR